MINGLGDATNNLFLTHMTELGFYINFYFRLQVSTSLYGGLVKKLFIIVPKTPNALVDAFNDGYLNSTILIERAGYALINSSMI
jgi:hypothetical protein